MSRKKRTHLRSERGQAFADQIRGIALDRILCASLDVHKYFHLVMIHNALGEIVTPTFEIDIFQTGVDRLCQAMDEALARTHAQLVLLGLEPSSHYFENFAPSAGASPASDLDQRFCRQAESGPADDAAREGRRD